MVANGGSRTPYLHLMRVVRYRFSTPQWCQWMDLNHRPLAYEASVLNLLNYTGIYKQIGELAQRFTVDTLPGLW